MINFTHKACNADGENAEKVANRIKSNAKKTTPGPIENLLSIDIYTDTELIKLTELTDFPKLNKAKLLRKVFFGSHFWKHCRSYLADIIKNGKLSVVTNDTIRSIKTNQATKKLLYKTIEIAKIIGIEIAPRHTRSLDKAVGKNIIEDNYMKKFKKPYAVYIQYIPGRNTTKAIKGLLHYR